MLNKSEQELEEINFLDDIDYLEHEYNNYNDEKVLNLSDWNPSLQFKNKLVENLSFNYCVDPIDYIFSYSLDNSKKNIILERLGLSNKSILFTHSGSASIFNCVNMLNKIGIKKLIVICPVYFTLFYACKVLGIECENVYLQRNENGYFIDESQLLTYKSSDCAFWITNPIYCTSVYYDQTAISIYKNLLKQHYIVFDESLALPNKEISNILGHYNHFIGIYSPHKSICMNGYKFSFLVAPAKQQNLLDAWADVFCGCLSAGNKIAISHFLSDNFTKYSFAFMKIIVENKSFLENICNDLGVDYDKNSYGYLITVYFPNISAEKGLKLSFLKDIMTKCGVRFITGERNHFDNNIGFCFRINLAAYNYRFDSALKRTFVYLMNI